MRWVTPPPGTGILAITHHLQYKSIAAETTQQSWKIRWNADCYTFVTGKLTISIASNDGRVWRKCTSARFLWAKIKQSYISKHLIALIPILSPDCTRYASWTLLMSKELDLWACCWKLPSFFVSSYVSLIFFSQYLLKGEVCAESNVQSLEEIASSLFKQLDSIYEYHDTFLREVWISWQRG